MKKMKFLSLLALALPVLTGCGAEEQPADNKDANVETKNICDEVLDHSPMLLRFTGQELQIVDSVREAADFDAYLGITDLMYRGETYDVSWECSPADKWKQVPQVGEMAGYTKFTPKYGDEEFDCSLTATVSKGDIKASATWKFKADIHETEDLTQYTYMSIHDMNANYFANRNSVANGTKYYTYGKITATVEQSSQHIYSGFWIQDGEDALYCYQVYETVWFAIEPKIGDTVIVGGTLNDYGGLMEMYVYNKPKSKVGFFDLAAENDEKANAVADPVEKNIDSIAWNNKGEICKRVSALVEMTDLVYVSGAEGMKPGTACTLKCKHGQTDVSVVVNYHIGTTAYEALKAVTDKFVANETRFDFKGVLSMFNNELNLNPIFGASSITVKAAA